MNLVSAIAARLHKRPWALWPGSTPAILGALRQTLELTPQDLRDASVYGAEIDTYRPYEVIGGVAIIPIQGVLFHGCDWYWWGLSTYEWIANCFRAALDDAEVKAIALHIDSPGGEVAGCFDLADAIFAARGTKPIWAVLDESAYSAGYALGCAADRLVVPRTGGTGSIGVVQMHIDITEMLQKDGIKITTSQFGERKTDSYPTTPLSEAARAAMDAETNALGEMFVDLVARNRKLAASAVRATEAGTFLGQAGVAAGLADAVLSPPAALTELIASLN